MRYWPMFNNSLQPTGYYICLLWIRMIISNVPYTVNIVWMYTHEMIIGLRHLICVSLKCSRPRTGETISCTVVCFVMAFSSYTDKYMYISIIIYAVKTISVRWSHDDPFSNVSYTAAYTLIADQYTHTACVSKSRFSFLFIFEISKAWRVVCV